MFSLLKQHTKNPYHTYNPVFIASTTSTTTTRTYSNRHPSQPAQPEVVQKDAGELRCVSAQVTEAYCGYKTKHHLFTSGVSSLCRDSVCVQALFSCPYVMGRASEKNGETRIKDKRRVEIKEEVNIVKTKEDSIYFVARERIGIFYPWLSALIILRIMYSGRNMYNLQI